MRKLAVFAILVVVGASVAVASSLSVPWFVDNVAAGNGIPSSDNGVTGIVTLKSNVTDVLVCTIEYYNQDGFFLGPLEPVNTFTINPLSGCAFRPTIDDPAPGITSPWGGVGQAGGQESNQGAAVPNRPRSPDTDTVIPGSRDADGLEFVDTKKNGALVVGWIGGDQDIQGNVCYYQRASNLTMSYAHLLPPGM